MNALRRLSALLKREVLEILRDPFRLSAAFIVPGVMMLIFGFGLSVDIEQVPFAALDQDRTPASRDYIDHFARNRYFADQGVARSRAELTERLRTGELKMALEIPPGFGRDLTAGRVPQVAILADGTMPFRAETVRSYAEAMHLALIQRLAQEKAGADTALMPASVETRYWYNQALKSRVTFVPGLIAVILTIVPAMLTAVAVVREKELGSITNLYATPVTRLEFLLGKQLPYAVISYLNFILLAVAAVLLFGVPLKGSVAALALGAALAVLCSTGIGMLISAFTRSQAAALLITMILTLVPSFLYSGLLTPVSGLGPGGTAFAYGTPTMYFLNITVGAFSKGLALADLAPNLGALALFFVGLTAVSTVLVKKQGA
ncbi:ABC transporter permease [Oleisolibacter albus]|uniref:ABC transporter permease n=1 Tax=Oleisolibacter albus TaxID=2171757 RepID=UPI001EFEB969|nr:ABC transporter permease [Oleisolibacter albus]